MAPRVSRDTSSRVRDEKTKHGVAMVKTMPVTKSVSKTRPDLSQAKPIAAVKKTGTTMAKRSAVIPLFEISEFATLRFFERRETQQRDLISLATDDLESRFVVLENLTNVRDGLGFVDDNSCDCYRFFVG
jgi:hypothetical protein